MKISFNREKKTIKMSDDEDIALSSEQMKNTNFNNILILDSKNYFKLPIKERLKKRFVKHINQ